MIASYLKTAVRYATSNYLYSVINIVGLSIGLACCLLILLYVRHELSYESGFANAERIYRVSREYYPTDGARLRVPASNNAPMTPALMADYPQQIETAGRIFGGNMSLRTDELTTNELQLRYADQTILQIFDFEWLAGNPQTALVEPNSLVLTETLARKYFGTTDALGLGIRGMGTFDLEVTGVIRDLPANTHMSLSGLVSLNSITNVFGPEFLERWNGTTDFHTYVLLRPETPIGSVEQDVSAFIDRHLGPEASTFTTLRFMNVRDIHLRSDRDEEWQPHGSSSRVYSFAAIAFSILVIACINFMSIATARSSLRAREVGMRKTLGATQRQLVLQFLGEAALFALVSIVMAVAVAEMLLPAFSVFAGMELQFAYLEDMTFIGTAVALTFFVAFFAGSYPAFYLTGFETARVLKGEVTRGKQGLLFRSALVVFQFSIAITLLISTAVVVQQRELVESMDLGFNKDQVVVVASAAPEGFQQDWPAFKQELLANAAIDQVTASHYLPFGFNDNQVEVGREGGAATTRIQYMMVDHDFFSTYEIDFLAGRDFSRDLSTDEGTLAAGANEAVRFIVNASAARALGMNAVDIVGTELRIVGSVSGSVVGVVQDTHFESIRSAIRPLLFILVPPQTEQNFQRFFNAAVRVRADSVPAALAHIDATWKALYPNQTLNRHFLDNDFQAQYQAEEKQGRLFTYFSLLAVLIACFGLFGLASFNAERRTKEIGVRKVMGGSVWSIVLLLTNDFSKLVLVANVIAWPLAYVAMGRWLEQFVYRIDLTPVIFIGSGLIALCIAWVTVGGTAAKAASAKPILALRYE